jgi:hypothetical protein
MQHKTIVPRGQRHENGSTQIAWRCASVALGALAQQPPNVSYDGAMTKREAIWVLWGLGLGAACSVAIFGFGLRTHASDGRLAVVTLLGGGVAYLAAKIARIGKPNVR